MPLFARPVSGSASSGIGDQQKDSMTSQTISLTHKDDSKSFESQEDDKPIISKIGQQYFANN